MAVKKASGNKSVASRKVTKVSGVKSAKHTTSSNVKKTGGKKTGSKTNTTKENNQKYISKLQKDGYVKKKNGSMVDIDGGKVYTLKKNGNHVGRDAKVKDYVSYGVERAHQAISPSYKKSVDKAYKKKTGYK